MFKSALLPKDEILCLPGIAPEALNSLRAGWAQVEPADPLGESGVDAWVTGRIGGERGKTWQRLRFRPSTAPSSIYRAGPVWHLPRAGLVITDQGELLTDSASKRVSPQPALAGLPGIKRVGDADVFAAPARAPTIDGASLFVPYGGFNYGHFFIDGLSGLLALQEAGLTRDLPPLAPPLKPWQRGLIRLAFGDLAVREVKAGVVRLENAAYCSNINHFLHHPNALLARLVAQVRSRLPPAPRRDRKLLLSRGNYSMRIMVNAREVEAALAARGFEIVEPHRLSPQDQACLLAQARIVIGPTGAGMTNALFMAPGATVLEIQPENFSSFWLGAGCHAVGLDWHAFVVASPAPETESPWLARQRRGYAFGFRVPVDGLMRFLDRL